MAEGYEVAEDERRILVSLMNHYDELRRTAEENFHSQRFAAASEWLATLATLKSVLPDAAWNAMVRVWHHRDARRLPPGSRVRVVRGPHAGATGDAFWGRLCDDDVQVAVPDGPVLSVCREDIEPVEAAEPQA